MWLTIQNVESLCTVSTKLFVKIMCGKLADKYSLKYRQSVERFRRAAIKFNFLHYNTFNILCNIVLQEKR